MQMCIDRPRGLVDLFSTHPKVEDRIAALRGMPQRASIGPRTAPRRAAGPGGMPVRAAFGQRSR
jgi:hypothetical protein